MIGRTAVFADLIRDLRYALRSLRRHPVVAGAAVLSLAIGIGGNTAVFSLVDAIMLRSLPVPRPEELVVLSRDFPGRGTTTSISYPAFERFRDANIFGSITASATVERSGVRVEAADLPDTSTWRIGLVSGAYFSTFQVSAGLGRTLTPDDDGGEGTVASPVAVLSDRGWRQRFGSSPEVIGRTFTLNGTVFQILGVTPGFSGEDLGAPVDVWVPIGTQSQLMPERPGLQQNMSSNWLQAIGRLKPGISFEQTQAAARTIFLGLPPTSSPFGTPRLALAPAGQGFTLARERLRPLLEILAAIVGAVLLIACANVSMLALARATEARRDVAVRLAIGASRARLIRQQVAEGLLLAALSGTAGLVTAVWMTRALASLAGSGRVSFVIDTRPNLRMLAVAVAVSLTSGLVATVLPAVRAMRGAVTATLTASDAASRSAAPRLRTGRTLVVVQVAVSVALTLVAALFVRTLRNLEHQDVGFDRDRVWMFWMAPSESGRQGAALVPFFAAAQERVSTLPGVISASASTDGVMSGFVGLRGVFAEGHAAAPGEDINTQWNLIGPRFFDTIGMQLLAGRDIGPQDTETSPLVAVVNETMAKRFFADANPIGRHFGFGQDLSHPIEIVGLVRDAKYLSTRDAPEPMVFLPYRQDAPHLFRMCLVVRLASSSPSLIARIRQELARIDPSVPLRLVNTTADQINLSLTDERLTAWLAGCFSLFALLLAGVGLYGVMSYSVARRTREIGVRVALGETRGAILGRVVRESLALVLTGVCLGLPAAMVGAHAMRALLFGVVPADVGTAVGVAMTLIAVALVASSVPARRAAAVDPAVALRAE